MNHKATLIFSITLGAVISFGLPAFANQACTSRCQKAIDDCPHREAVGSARAADERSHVACFKGCEDAAPKKAKKPVKSSQ